MSALVLPPYSVLLLEERDALDLLVIGTIFASFLIPAAVLLFIFTPVRAWQTPLFILNVLAVILGLVQQVLYICAIINTLLLIPVPSAMLVSLPAFDFLVPVLVQCIPMIRLIEAYPPSQSSRTVNMVIYVPIIVLKITSLVNAGYGTYAIASRTADTLGLITAAWVVWDTTYVKIQWVLQIFDDMLVTGLLAYKLYRGVNAMNRNGADTGKSVSRPSIYTWALRFRTIFNVAKIVIVFFDPSFFHSAIVITVNGYLTTLGVLVSTIWGYDTLVRPAEPPRAGTAMTAASTLPGRFASRQVPRNPHSLDVHGEEDESTSSTLTRGRKGIQSPGGSILRGTADRGLVERRVSASSSALAPDLSLRTPFHGQ